MSGTELAVLIVAVTVIAFLLITRRPGEIAPPNLPESVAMPYEEADVSSAWGATQPQRDAALADEAEGVPLAPPPDLRFHRPKREVADEDSGLIMVAEYGYRSHPDPQNVDDAEVFHDELFVQFAHRNTGLTWISHYVVATPLGLKRKMTEEGVRSMLRFDGLLVDRFDADVVLTELLTQVSHELADLPEQE